MGAGIAKDRAYARMFGTVAPRGLPATSYLFFFSRDVVTMGASFNIPEPLAEEMAKHGVPKSTADVAAQLFCPVAMQFITTPMHLLGLDCYNRPAQTFQERIDLVAANYRKTVAARIARILPAFGFGGIGNKRCVFVFWGGCWLVVSCPMRTGLHAALSPPPNTHTPHTPPTDNKRQQPPNTGSATRATRTSGAPTTSASRSPWWCSGGTGTPSRPHPSSPRASRGKGGPPCCPPRRCRWASPRWWCQGWCRARPRQRGSWAPGCEGDVWVDGSVRLALRRSWMAFWGMFGLDVGRLAAAMGRLCVCSAPLLSSIRAPLCE